MQRLAVLKLYRQAGVTAAVAAAAAAEMVRAEGPAPPPAAVPLTRSTWTGSSSFHAHGEDHGSAKPTRADVYQIRRLRAEGMPTGQLAKRYGVTRGTICYTCSRKTWADQSPPLPASDDRFTSHQAHTTRKNKGFPTPTGPTDPKAEG